MSLDPIALRDENIRLKKELNAQSTAQKILTTKLARLKQPNPTGNQNAITNAQIQNSAAIDDILDLQKQVEIAKKEMIKHKQRNEYLEKMTAASTQRLTRGAYTEVRSKTDSGFHKDLIPLGRRKIGSSASTPRRSVSTVQQREFTSHQRNIEEYSSMQDLVNLLRQQLAAVQNENRQLKTAAHILSPAAPPKHTASKSTMTDIVEPPLLVKPRSSHDLQQNTSINSISIEQYESEIREFRSLISSLESDNNEWKQKYHKEHAELENLRSSSDSEIRQLREEINRLNQEIQRLNEQIRNHRVIDTSSLEEALRQCQKSLEVSESERNSLQVQLDAYKHKYQRRKACFAKSWSSMLSQLETYELASQDCALHHIARPLPSATKTSRRRLLHPDAASNLNVVDVHAVDYDVAKYSDGEYRPTSRFTEWMHSYRGTKIPV